MLVSSLLETGEGSKCAESLPVRSLRCHPLGEHSTDHPVPTSGRQSPQVRRSCTWFGELFPIGQGVDLTGAHRCRWWDEPLDSEGLVVGLHAEQQRGDHHGGEGHGLGRQQPSSCVTKTTTGASASLSVAWKGSLNGFLDGTTYAGKAPFTASTVPGTSLGSFFGPAEVGVDAPSNLATSCGAKRGIEKLTLAGTVIIGTQVVQTIPVGVTPHGVSSDGTHVWVAGSSVTELDASTGAVVQTIGVGSGAEAISSDGTHVWVVNEGGNSVTELDASTGAVVQTIGVGNFPDAVSSDGTHVWVANSGDNTVTELDASTGAVVQTIDVGTTPSGVSSDGTDVWVTNEDDNTVTELNASTGAVVQTIGVGVAPDAVSSDETHVG